MISYMCNHTPLPKNCLRPFYVIVSSFLCYFGDVAFSAYFCNITVFVVVWRVLYVVDLPICSPWTFRENHSPNIIYTMNRRNQPTAMDLYFLDWVRTRYKTEPETHTKSAHTVL